MYDRADDTNHASELSRMSTVVYLIDQPLDQRNYDRFGIQTWLDRGWTVKVWDLTPLSQPSTWQGYVESRRGLKEFPGYSLIASASQLQRTFAQSADIDYYVDFCGDSYHGVCTKLHLSHRGAVRIICAVGSIPEAGVGTTSGLASKIRTAITEGPVRSFKWLTRVCLNRIVARWAAPGLVVVSGANSMSLFSRWSDRETLRAHNLDYDIYLRLRTSVMHRAPYAVFLDQGLSFHPDYAYDDIPVYVTPGRYFPALCRGLRKISGTLGVDLRVAAHPRSNYPQAGSDCFEGISIDYGVTPELIRDCHVVVGHYSAAIQLAVLFGKPIIFLTTDELMRSPIGPLIVKFAAELGKTVINLDSDLDAVNWRIELSIDAQKYAEYNHRYIKMNGSPDVPHWDIVIDHISRKQGLAPPAVQTTSAVEH